MTMLLLNVIYLVNIYLDEIILYFYNFKMIKILLALVSNHAMYSIVSYFIFNTFEFIN